MPGLGPSTAWLRSRNGTNRLASLRHSQEPALTLVFWVLFWFLLSATRSETPAARSSSVSCFPDDTWTVSPSFRGKGLVSPEREAGGEEGARFHPWWGCAGVSEPRIIVNKRERTRMPPWLAPPTPDQRGLLSGKN